MHLGLPWEHQKVSHIAVAFLQLAMLFPLVIRIIYMWVGRPVPVFRRHFSSLDPPPLSNLLFIFYLDWYWSANISNAVISQKCADESSLSRAPVRQKLWTQPYHLKVSFESGWTLMSQHARSSWCKLAAVKQNCQRELPAWYLLSRICNCQRS